MLGAGSRVRQAKGQVLVSTVRMRGGAMPKAWHGILSRVECHRNYTGVNGNSKNG